MDWTAVTAILGAMGGLEGVRYLLNRKANRRITDAEADKAETDAMDTALSSLKKALNEATTALNTANVTIKDNQERMGAMNKTIDKLVDETRHLKDQMYESQLQVNHANDRIVALVKEAGYLRLERQCYAEWHCRFGDCPDRRPPNEKLKGRKFGDPIPKDAAAPPPNPDLPVPLPPQGCE